MHLFFDTVWKLHIGEIPEKPEPKPHYLGNAYGERRYKCLVQEYNEAIAAIKQNALTVLNPEIGIVESSCGTKCMIDGYVGWDRVLLHSPIQADKFYKWIGGYETKEKDIYVEAGGNYIHTETITVAILTLPEEKKNTMENMTEKDLAIKMANRALEVPYADPDSDICTISRQFLRLIELTASSSVAAPKKHPDFNEWIEKKEGKDCLQWPVSDQRYLKNRLFWAFDAGRNCVWYQYINQKKELESAKEALKDLLAITETNVFNYNEYKAIIERARKTLSKEF